MKKYKISGTKTIQQEVCVEANSHEEAFNFAKSLDSNDWDEIEKEITITGVADKSVGHRKIQRYIVYGQRKTLEKAYIWASSVAEVQKYLNSSIGNSDYDWNLEEELDFCINSINEDYNKKL